MVVDEKGQKLTSELADGRHPGVIIEVGDQGAASPDPIVLTTDQNLSSALGGDSATRSSTAAHPDDEEPRDPDEE